MRARRSTKLADEPVRARATGTRAALICKLTVPCIATQMAVLSATTSVLVDRPVCDALGERVDEKRETLGSELEHRTAVGAERDRLAVVACSRGAPRRTAPGNETAVRGRRRRRPRSRRRGARPGRRRPRPTPCVIAWRQLVEDPRDDGHHDGVAVGEVGVDRRSGDPDLTGDGAKRHRLVGSFPVDERERSGDDLLGQPRALATGVALPLWPASVASLPVISPSWARRSPSRTSPHIFTLHPLAHMSILTFVSQRTLVSEPRRTPMRCQDQHSPPADLPPESPASRRRRRTAAGRTATRDASRSCSCSA